MGQRKKRAARCSSCRLHIEACICAWITPRATKTRLVLLMHHRELDKPTATGPLAIEALSNSELVVQGLKDTPIDLSRLHQQNRRCVLLFPGDAARILDATFVQADARPITLVVPDGSWPQARRMAKRVPGLENMECAVLPPGPPTQWGVRRETTEHGLATIEAIARAFGVLESPELALHLESIFLRHAAATRAARGESPPPHQLPAATLQPHDIPKPALEVIFHDDTLIAINKPSGMLTHRGWGQDETPALQHVRDHVGCTVYPVHRLDRATSGVLVFAKSSESARRMQLVLQDERTEKRYLALCRGRDSALSRIDHPVTDDTGVPRPAVTDFRLLGAFERYGLYEAVPRTGRTHQIRRHLKHVSQPIIGDVNYGSGEHNRIFRTRYAFHRLALHCSQLKFTHPNTDAAIEINAPLPGDFLQLLLELGLLDVNSGEFAT